MSCCDVIGLRGLLRSFIHDQVVDSDVTSH